MICTECPNEIIYDNMTHDEKLKYNFSRKIFLAGGITGCNNWQKYIIDNLRNENDNLILFNPRRNNFDITDKSIEEKQIKWEFKHINYICDQVLFWFCEETLCPIVLYELGTQICCDSLYLGIHPNYKRKRDIEIQSKLINPKIKISYSLDELIERIRNNKYDNNL